MILGSALMSMISDLSQQALVLLCYLLIRSCAFPLSINSRLQRTSQRRKVWSNSHGFNVGIFALSELGSSLDLAQATDWRCELLEHRLRASLVGGLYHLPILQTLPYHKLISRSSQCTGDVLSYQ